MSEKYSIERELRNLLSVDPPPGFEDRIRVRVRHKPQAFSWNVRWTLAAAAAVPAIVLAVLVGRPPRVTKPQVAVTASLPMVPAAVVEPAPAATPKLAAVVHHKVVKAAKAEPQLIIAANEASAMRRLLNGEITELPPLFQPEVKQFRTPEPVVEPLLPPAPVTIDPIEPSIPAGQ
jgi:hypothetical protein